MISDNFNGWSSFTSLACLMLLACAGGPPRHEVADSKDPTVGHDVRDVATDPITNSHKRCRIMDWWATLERSDHCDRSFVLTFDARTMVDCGQYASDDERHHARDWAQRTHKKLHDFPCCWSVAQRPAGPEWASRLIASQIDLFAHRYRSGPGTGESLSDGLGDDPAKLASALTTELRSWLGPSITLRSSDGVVVVTIASNPLVHDCR